MKKVTTVLFIFLSLCLSLNSYLKLIGVANAADEVAYPPDRDELRKLEWNTPPKDCTRFNLNNPRVDSPIGIYINFDSSIFIDKETLCQVAYISGFIDRLNSTIRFVDKMGNVNGYDSGVIEFSSLDPIGVMSANMPHCQINVFKDIRIDNIKIETLVRLLQTKYPHCSIKSQSM